MDCSWQTMPLLLGAFPDFVDAKANKKENVPWSTKLFGSISTTPDPNNSAKVSG